MAKVPVFDGQIDAIGTPPLDLLIGNLLFLCSACVFSAGLLHHYLCSWNLHPPIVDCVSIATSGSGPVLPTRGSDEFRPFIRRLPEFKFWHSLTKAICFAFVSTFFSAFDVPVFWPILLFYWVVLFISTMKRQIMHMIKYKYVPFTFGKQRYQREKTTPAIGASTTRT